MPLEIIYGGKTKASLPHGFEFPKDFVLTQNPKHWSNEQETIKVLKEVIDSYVKKQVFLDCPQHNGIIIAVWDAFEGLKNVNVKM